MLSTDRQTDRQTDKLTNATKNITSFAKEVIRSFTQKQLNVACVSVLLLMLHKSVSMSVRTI